MGVAPGAATPAASHASVASSSLYTLIVVPEMAILFRSARKAFSADLAPTVSVMSFQSRVSSLEAMSNSTPVVIAETITPLAWALLETVVSKLVDITPVSAGVQIAVERAVPDNARLGILSV